MSSDEHCKECECLGVRIDELEKQLTLHVKYQQEAVNKAHGDLATRLEGMNEFRAALKDQAALFLTREELTLLHNAMQSQISRHQDVLNNWSGRIWALCGMLVLMSGLVSAVVTWLLERN